MVIRESPRHFDSPDIACSSSALLEAFSNFDHLIFVSRRGCDAWRQFPEIAAKPCSVLPNCCEEEEMARYAAEDRAAVRERCGFREEDFVVLCPGTIEHRKGQDLVLDILPMLQEKIANLKLLLVGNPHSEWGQHLLENIPDVFLNRSVFHRPAQPGIAELLFASDLLAFPSRAEAMPRTILEAMALKTPVVASDVDGTPELVVDGQTGLLFPSGDANGLLRAIERMHADPELRAATAAAGCERYWELFSRRRQFERMPEILEEIQTSVSVRR
jgi:glycosyltransferase involved in cell wall biosynthesis